MTRHTSWLSNSWFVSLGSLAAIGILVLFLWEPWNKRGIAGGKTLQLYCAAGVMKPVTAILDDYRRDYGVTVQTSPGGTGELLSQISRTGRGDLFLAADTLSIQIAKRDKLVTETIPVAVLKPVIVIRKDKQAELKAKGQAVTSIKDLLRDDLKVVVANQSASIGKASLKVLTPSGVWAKLKDRQGQPGAKVSEMGTVMEVAGAVQTRSEFIGIVWSGVARQYKDLEIVTTPELDAFEDHLWIGVLANAADPTAALQFARYLSARDKGLVHFEKNHIEPVADADVWAERPQIRLAAGAMLKPGLEEAVKSFAEREGVEVDTIYNGCGHLVAMMRAIQTGSKSERFPDAYFSCDVSFLHDVAQWFERPHEVTKNDVVIIVPPGNPRSIRTLTDLARLSGTDARIGLAHETNSALGKLTADLAKKLGIYEAFYARQPAQNIVYADAAHTLVNQLAGVGSLDAAVVYRSNVLSNPKNTMKVEIVEIPEGRALATQPFAVAAASQHKHLVRRLFDTIVSPEGTARFKAAGFEWVYQGVSR